mgnify:CR=1 FL=1
MYSEGPMLVRHFLHQTLHPTMKITNMYTRWFLCKLNSSHYQLYLLPYRLILLLIHPLLINKIQYHHLPNPHKRPNFFLQILLLLFPSIDIDPCLLFSHTINDLMQLLLFCLSLLTTALFAKFGIMDYVS